MSKIRIIHKLQKLIAHEQSAREMGNEGEANNFRRRIDALRAAHGITEEIRTDDAHDTFGSEPVFPEKSKLFRKKRILWEEVLFANLCGYFECQPVMFTDSNFKVMIGERADRQKVRECFLDLHKSALFEVKEYFAIFYEIPKNERAKLRSSFLLGFANSIGQRLVKIHDMRTQLDTIADVHNIVPERIRNSQTALVKSQVVRVSSARREMAEKLDNMPKIEDQPPKIENIDQSAAECGYHAGNDVALPEILAEQMRQARADLGEVQSAVMRKNMQRYLISLTSGASSTTSFYFYGD